MKKLNRLLSALLTVCLLLGALAGLSIIEVGATGAATPDTPETTETIDYMNTVFASPEAKLATMKYKLTKDGFQLWVDPYTGEVATVNVATGQILFTNPYDVASADAANSDSTKEELLSQLVIKYIDNANNGIETSYFSYTRAAVNNQIKVKNIKNGIRVEYTIGREETKYLVPRLIEKSRFEELLYNVFAEQIPDDDSTEAKNMKFLLGKMRAYYSLIDPNEEGLSETIKNQYYADYPITKQFAVYVFDQNASAKELTTVENLVKTYCPNYTYEELDKDHEMTKYTSSDQNPPLFKMALEYTLNEDGVTVRLPANGIRFDESLYQLTNISILPYMGCGSYKDASPNTGYTFFPDGSGSLFRFEDLSGSFSTIISGKVYGQDYAYHTITGTHQEVIRYPVFGVVQDTTYVHQADAKGLAVGTNYIKNDTTVSSGYFAIIEEGDALTTLYTNHVPNVNKYHSIQMMVNPRPNDSFILSDAISVGSNAPVTIVSERKYTGNFRIKYFLLTDKNVAAENNLEKFYSADWIGMRNAYRDYLIKKEVLTRITDSAVKDSIPLYIETFGALETTEKILSIPVDVMVPLTSFEDVQTMYEDLQSVGITNVNFKLTGYANGGMYSTVPYGLKWESSVGGKKGFEKLIAYAAEVNAKEENNLGIYPDFDFAYIQTQENFDGVSLDKHAVKTIDNRYTSKRVYSATHQAYVSYWELALSPAYFSRFYEKLTSNYLKYSKAGDGSDLRISVASLGSALNSDFDEDEPYNREDSKMFTEEAFKYLAEHYGKVMTESANAYTLKYIDNMLNMPLDSSRFLRASNSIPFVGYVLHGYVEYAGTPINMEGDIQYALLKAIENGASLYFILSYQNTTKLKDYTLLSQYYSIRYDIWCGSENEFGEFQAGQLVDLYKELNEATADLQTKVLIDHEFLTGERVPDEDEAEADAKAAELAEEAKKAAAELAAKTEWAAKILAAKTTAVDDAKAALTAANALLDQFEALQNALEGTLLADDLTSEDEAIRDAAIEDVKGALKAVLANVDAVKAQLTEAQEQLNILTEVYNAFKDEGTYSAAYLADFEAKINEAQNTVNDFAPAIAAASAAWESAKTTAATVGVTEADVVSAAAGDTTTPDAPVEEEKSGFNKYFVDDGSLVAVTYGGKNGVDSDPYRTFLLNYNYYAVTLTYKGILYTINPYDYVIINY